MRPSPAFNYGVGHLVRAIAGEPVDTARRDTIDEEVSVQFPVQAEQWSERTGRCLSRVGPADLH